MHHRRPTRDRRSAAILARVVAMKALHALPLALFLAVALAVGAFAQQKKPPTEPKASDCTATMGELPKAWDGQAFALDGATLGGVGLKPHLRLWGIQAPELRDATKAENVPGMRARAFLADLLAKADHKVKCRPARFDRDCRLIAQCSVAEAGTSTDLGGSMLAAGMAYGADLDEALPWESRAGQRYADAEFEARKARKGLWPIWLGDR
jgi:endonuclease YncB( thermonuclease family)